jgi:tetraacyldisaccharide 4'-kinase
VKAERGGRRRPEDLLAANGAAVEFLRPLAWAFGGVVRLRNRLYDAGLLRAARVAAPVVCVGNLSTGGTGKTPMVVHVVRELARRGRRPGVLSRGYKAAAHESADGPRGDEARMLAQLLPGVPLVQDRERVRGAALLLQRGCDAVVLDDGFQHRRLARDLDLVLVDATRPFGLPWSGDRAPEWLLPRGLLREPAAGLARAGACVVTRSDQVEPQRLARLEERLRDAAPGVPVVLARHRPTGLVARDGERFPLERLAGRDVELVSGIGNAAAFEATVAALGARVVEHRRFPDHHHYSAADLAGLCRASRVLVTTAKDAVKIEGLVPAAFVLAIEIEIVRGAAVLEALFDALPLSVAARARRHLHEGLHG